jgi:Gram-negative bacterial TonB protein C-terminal
MSIGPLIRTREELYVAPPIKRPLGATEEKGARLVELRTDSGLMYIRPSGWQRLRLLWTFRHFQVLPPQLLSSRDQRLIERLFRSARVTPALPVPRSTIFGAVEKVRTKSDQSVVFFEELAGSAAPDERVEGVREFSFPQRWAALGIGIAICLMLILGRVFGVSLLKGAAQIGESSTMTGPTVQAAVGAAVPPVQAAVRAAVPAPVQSSVPIEPPAVSAVEKAAPRALPPERTLVARKSAPLPGLLTQSVIEPVPPAAPVESPAIAPAIAPKVASAGASQRAFVSNLPQGHLVQPVLTDPKLAGEVQLRAFISADGSVQEVSFVSGDSKLAEAGIAAVRRWHYAQSQAPGSDGEREALIRMNFFGQDAVSISSVAR